VCGYASFLDYVYTPTLLRIHSAQLFDWVARGDLKVRIGGIYPLAEAARVHADMETRTTTGKLLPIP
jgi:NADPH2:quinone reductase